MNINGYSFARVVLHMYFPAMYLYDLSADSQPQPCPTAFGGEKRVENVGNNIWRYALRLFSVDSSEIFSNRFFIVEVLSSAAKMPFPGATNCLAIDLSFSMSIDLFE